MQHTDALGCLLVIKMILSVLDRHRHARSMWHTWRVIPGKYRRRFGPLGYSSRLPLNPRYRNNDLQESTQYVATHIAQHEVGLSMIAWPLVDKSRLHICLTCLEVQLLSPCLRTGGPIRRVQCAHVVILLALYSNATDWVEAWFCWGHSVCSCSKHLLSLSCHVRPVTAPKPAQEVPFSLRCHCIAAQQHLCQPRSGQSSATVHKASEGHGNSKQPRFNMELDFTLGSQNYTSTVASMTARSHLSCVGGSCEPSGRSISGMEHASILEAVDAGCTSQIPGIISVPNRSADSQGYACRARLPQHPGCQLQPQRNGLTACQMSGSHILGIGLACSSAHLAVIQDAAKPTTINSKPKDEMDSVLDTCLSANRMFHPQNLDAALLQDTTQAATYVECGKFNLLLAVNVPLGCPYAGRCLAVSLHSQWFQVVVTWGSNESTVNSTQQKQMQVCSADDHVFASLISVERQLVLNKVPWITHAHTAIQHSVIRTLVLTCFGAIAVVRIICGVVRAVYAMLRVPDSSTTNHHETIARTQRPCTNYVLSRPGPKSGGGIPCRSAHALLITAYFCIKGATGVKVAPPAVGGAEGGQAQPCHLVAPPKPYGYLSQSTALLQDQVRKTTKRSFKRACRRALQYGQAKYKGSTITMKMVQSSWLDCAKAATPPHRSIRERKGLRVFCWNSGGLASGQWDELLLHIDPQAWDIVLIQETHWAESRDFVTGPWSCIASSAGKGSKAGVLVMIHQRLCHSSMLRGEHVMPGRLLRIRLPLPGTDLRHLQVLCAYQKAWNSQQASSAMEQRSGFWNKLDGALASVPSRDALILGGDLNVSIPMTAGASGAGVGPPPQDGAPDAPDLIGIAKQHGLVFLNTWRGRGTPVHTFQFGKCRAQLDFLLCKTLHADGIARQSRPWHNFQLSQGSESGAVHYPVHASIPVKKADWHCQGTTSNSAINKEAIIQAACNLPVQEADSVIRLRQAVRHEMQKLEHPSQLAQVPHIVSRTCMQLFPALNENQRQKQAVWQDTRIVASVKETWQLWRFMKAVTGRTLVSMFRKWSFLARHLKARRLQRKLSKQTRRQKLLSYVDQAAEAASKHDVRRLYEVVNKLSKPRQKRVALRGPRNDLLSAEEEADLLADHFSTRFKAVYEEDVALQQFPWSTEGNIQLDEFALSCAYAAAPLRKAVPPGHPPSAVWRLIAQETAVTVSRVVNQAWSEGTASIPKSWSDAFLVLLPKPDKSGADPKHLRPIGLQDQVGKLTLHTLLVPHKDLIYQHTNRYPQFAYTPGRSYRGALYRVFQHCDHVRNLCRQHHRNLQARYVGGDVTKLVGGLQVSVDLTQAFDQMPRWLLLQGMRSMGLDEDFVSVVMQWITQSEYEVSHMGHTRRFAASRGVRQGCVASPILWIIFVHTVCEELAGKVGYHRICQVLTLFADDIHGQWVFHSLAELEEALDVLALLFNVLHKFGMTVNASKSRVILAVAGTQASQIKKRFVRVIENCPHLKVNDKGLLIPLVDSFVYLGVKVGYKGFEDDTLHHRLAKGKANYWRLAKILRGKHALSAKTRMQLWRSCVWTSISYGLDCVGLTQMGASLLETSVLRQVRAALSCPSHITHVSSQDLMQKYGMDLPQIMIREQMESTKLPTQVCPEDLHSPGDWFQHVLLTLRPSCLKPVLQDSVIAVCPECGISYASRKAMLVHASRVHKITLSQTCARKLNKLIDALPGPPKCAHCFTPFTKVEGLRKHIELGRCRVLNAKISESEKPEHGRQRMQSNQVTAQRVTSNVEPARVVVEKPQSLDKGNKPEPNLNDGLEPQDNPHPEPVPTTPSNQNANPSIEKVSKVVFIHREDVQQALQLPRANGIYRLQNKREIAQVCAVCGQWIVSQYKMKNHYLNSHKQLHASLNVAATKLCASFSSPGSPCLHCGLSSIEPSKHRTTCPVLWQFCLLHLQATHHGGGCVSVRASADASGDADGGCGGSGTARGQANQGAKNGTREQRQGSNQRQQDVKTFFRGRRDVRGAGETSCQSSPPTGNPATSSQTGHILGSLLGAQRPPGNDVQGRSGMENSGRAEEGQPFTARHSDVMSVCSSAQYLDQDHRRIGHVQARSSTRMDPDGQVAVPGVGYSGEVSQGGCTQTGNGAQRPFGVPGHASQVDSSARDDQSIPCNKAFNASASGPNYVPAGGEPAVQGCGSSMASSGVDGRPLRPSDGGPSNQEGYATTRPFGGQHPESARVLQLRLNNRTNICYINSFVKSWVWTVKRAGHSDACSFGNAVQAWRDVLCARKPQFVSCLPSWRPLLRQWQRVNSQHDVVEFAEHILQHMQTSVTAGSWESRTLEGGSTHVWSSGTTHRAIHLHLDSQPGQSLQSLVHRWSGQAMIHALTNVPDVLILQVMRYYATGAGPNKLDVPVLLDPQIRVPVFTQDINTSMVDFKIQAIIQHHGATTNAGHYTATLLEAMGKYWACDDGVIASPLTQIPDATLRNAYTLLLTKCSAPR